MRRAGLALLLCSAAGLASAQAPADPGGLTAAEAPADPGGITAARYAEPTDRYDHGVLGDAIEQGALQITAGGRRLTFRLPLSHVFEDTAPRIADLDDDGQAEVLVVETDIQRGAALAVYDARGRRAATPPIGQPRRWLAPAGWGDFDGDGRTEIAYIDRPHLARELVFVRLDGAKLTELARAPGFTNHWIGDAQISGGVQRCAGRDSLILASADGTRQMRVTLGPDGPVAQDMGPWRKALPPCP